MAQNILFPKLRAVVSGGIVLALMLSTGFGIVLSIGAAMIVGVVFQLSQGTLRDEC